MNTKEKKLPLTLARILLNVPDHEFRPTPKGLSEMVFDQRHDFILTLPSPMLAVRMEFANERSLNGKRFKGVRRPMTVTLADSANNDLHSFAKVSANIRSGRFYDKTNVCLPINFDKVDFNHQYVVTVRDVKSGKILGEQTLHFFRQFKDSLYVTEWLRPVCAGVVPDYSEDMYRSFDADLMSYHKVRFNLVPDEDFTIPTFLPEMEVRIYFPDGTIDSKFIVPVRDETDSESESYIVSSPFYMTMSRKGICYAELICHDSPIAGIVFNTEGDPEYGPWSDAHLEILDEYSLHKATETFKLNLTVCEDEKPVTITDDDFEKALEEFISSQQETKEETTVEEKETVENIADETSQSEEEPQPEEEFRKEVEEYVSPLKSLDNLTGLRSVKEKLLAYEKLVLFNKKREECDLPILKLPLHAMFWGSPGTGKTTVAKRMGLMLKRAGLLSKGHVVVKERASLMGIHYGDQEVKTLEALEEAQGGILFIDEAYQLFQHADPKDPGRIVIDSLLTALADESKRDWMLILAGYTDEMKRMFEINPGLKSRIPESNIYIFDDFSENELMEIAERYLERNSYSMTETAKTALSMRLSDDYRNRSRSFGNARHVLNMIQTEILPSMASRVIETGNPDVEMLSLIQSCDIPKPQKLVQTGRPKIGYCA